MRTFAYTNHTVLPEALEEWPIDMLGRLLPRHMEIIYQINHYFMRDVSCRYPGDFDRLRRMSIIAEDGVKRVRMAYLAVVGSHKVNGVAELHTRLLKETLLRDFAEMWPERFTNMTNGITPRRWLRQANPGLAGLITDAIGEGWAKQPGSAAQPGAIRRRHRLPGAVAHGQAGVQKTDYRAAAARERADRLTGRPLRRAGQAHPRIQAPTDVRAVYHHPLPADQGQSGRAHGAASMPFGGKAAPGYDQAKLIIRLINDIGNIINHDPAMRDLLQVAFLPNYRVSLAEQLIPSANLSEQISTAGKEASGTGNMKFTLNGALTIGTLDGANIEIMEEVGRENIFIFGMNADEVAALKGNGYRPWEYVERNPLLQRALSLLQCGFFSQDEPTRYLPLYNELMGSDTFCLLADFDAYFQCQSQVVDTYLDPARWTRMSILNVARSGKFSSDRTIRQYAREIWNVNGMEVNPEIVPPTVAEELLSP